MAITAKAPWWVGVALAFISFGVLHVLAGSQPPAPTTMNQMGTAIAWTAIRTFAMFFQYVLPVVFLIGAGMSAYKRSKREELVFNVATAEHASVLGDMTWQEFEALVSEAFRIRGYVVKETGGGGADGGVDMVLTKGTEKFIVQCKQWRAQKVPVMTVRELYGVMAARGAAGGFVVSAGSYTADAREFARGRNIELIDGVAFFDMVRSVREKVDAVPQATAAAGTR